MTSSPISNPSHLEPSQLGTKEYWDNLYTTEMTNHAQDPSDEGTVWFDDSGAEAKMLSFLQRKVVKEKLLLGEEVTESNCSFLDLGTGNGHFLFALRGDGDGGSIDSEGESEPERSGEGGRELEGGGDGEGEALEGWGGRMLGVDYSARSVEFAKRIARDKGYGEGSGSGPRKEVEFLKWDIMSEDPFPGVLSGEQARGWDVVLDKGTFDAISLSDRRDERGRRVCEGYCGRVVPLIREGGVLLVTSCNWTEEELERWFVGPGAGEGGGELEVHLL